MMWKALWQKWTIDKPAALGDWLWDVFVVQFAAYLDRLTLRQIVTFIAAAFLILAYTNNVPVSPALIFVGDLVAYIDLFAVLMLLGVLGRIATIVFFVKQAAAGVARLAGSVITQTRRLDIRHRREGGAKGQKRLFGRRKKDDEPAAIGGFAWA